MAELREYRAKVYFEKDHVWAQVVELPGCFASGRDFAELREALEEALTMYLAETGDCRVEIDEFEVEPAVTKVPIHARLVPA